MRLVLGIAITLVLGSMFMSLFHLSASMDMSTSMTDCPFMVHEETLCPMTFADHIGAWKSVFTALVPVFAVLLLSILVVFHIPPIAPNLLLRRIFYESRLSRNTQKQVFSFIYKPLQELFSNGILHPKLF